MSIPFSIENNPKASALEEMLSEKSNDSSESNPYYEKLYFHDFKMYFNNI